MYTLVFLSCAAGLLLLLLSLDYLIYSRPPAWLAAHLLSPLIAEGKGMTIGILCAGLISAAIRDLRRSP